MYVGSSVFVEKRIRQHLRGIRDWTHANPLLRRQTGRMSYKVLEECAVGRLTEREQHYVDALNPKFNLMRRISRPEDTGGKSPRVIKAFRSVPYDETPERVGKYVSLRFHKARSQAECSIWLLERGYRIHRHDTLKVRIVAGLKQHLRECPVAFDVEVSGDMAILFDAEALDEKGFRHLGHKYNIRGKTYPNAVWKSAVDAGRIPALGFNNE